MLHHVPQSRCKTTKSSFRITKMAPDIAHLIEEVRIQTSSFDKNTEKDRQDLLRSARKLVHELESPAEKVCRMIYLDTSIWVSVRILVDLGVFEQLVAVNGPVTAKELAKSSNADPRLVERFLKFIAVENFVQETGPDEYAANDVTRVIASDDGAGAITDMYTMFAVYADWPAFLKETRYANPIDKDKSAFKYAYKTDHHYFDFISQPGNEERLKNFMGHMRFKTLGLKWFEEPKIIEAVFGDEGVGKEDVLLVDVGGSTGYDILNFHQTHADISGRLVLQDLPATIHNLDKTALAEKGIEALPHDFFTPEPIQHAKAYYLKMILHDWPDEQCKQILTNLMPALKPGYSRILLNEIVVPDFKAGWFETSVDVLMMEVHSAQERREKEWRQLVESVEGLKVRKIWDVEGAVEKIIEIERVS